MTIPEELSPCERFGHEYLITVSRPWRYFFRQVHWVSCWDCEDRFGPYQSRETAQEMRKRLYNEDVARRNLP